MVDFRVPLEIGAVRVRPGDILFGDIDGVCLIPTEAADEVFAKALEKVRGEKLVRKALEEGAAQWQHLRNTASCSRKLKTENRNWKLIFALTAMISIDLSGKSILITGALGAIAEFMVRKLAAAGATLVLLDIKSEEAAKQTLQDWKIPSSSYVYFPTDITDSTALNRVVAESFQRFPALDTVLGHAGGCGLHPFAATSEEDYDRIFRFNYFAQVNLARAVFCAMGRTQDRRPSHLHVFIRRPRASHPDSFLRLGQSGVGKLRPLHGAGVRSTGIRVNVVSPGNVAAGSSLKVFDEDPAYRQFVLRVSLGKRNSPESIADTFVFLCSPWPTKSTARS